MYVCVSPVRRETGSQWIDLSNRRLQPGSKLGRSQTQPPDEGWKCQIHCEEIDNMEIIKRFTMHIFYYLSISCTQGLNIYIKSWSQKKVSVIMMTD